MIENLIIKVIKENIKKGKYYTFDNKVISQNICIEDYFDSLFGIQFSYPYRASRKLSL